MSQEEALRMTAEVIDKSTGPLKSIQNALRGFAQEGAGHVDVLNKGFGRVEQSMQSVGRTATSVVNPALGSVGITALTVTAALAGIGAAMRNFGSSAKELGQLSRDTGVAAQTLREMQGILGKVGVDAGQSATAFQQFAENARLARRGIGPLMEFLRTQGTSAEGRKYFNDLADAIMHSKDNSEALTKALEGLEGVSDPVARRKYAQEVLGIAEAARLADGHLGTLRQQIDKFRSDNGVLSPQDIKNAEDYARAMDGLKGTFSKLGDAIAREATPNLTEAAKAVKAFLDDERKGVTPAIVEAIRDIATWLKSIDWTRAFAEAGDGFKTLKGDVTEAVTEIRTLLRDLGNKDVSDPIVGMFKEVGQAARDTGTAIRAAALALGALNDLKNFDFSEAGKKLDKIDRMADAGVGRRTNAPASKAPTALDEALDAQMRGQSASPEAIQQNENLRRNAGRAREIEDRTAAIQQQLGQFDLLRKSGTDNDRARDQADRLRREMERLTDELKRIREGGATVQQQSFDASAGGAFGGARIHTASLGGAAAAARVGRMLGGGGGIYAPGGEGGSLPLDPNDPVVRRRFDAFRANRGGAAAERVGGILRGEDTPRDDGRGSAGSARTSQMMGYAMDQLRREGVPEDKLREAAAHLVGQATMESGLDPNKIHDGGTGYDIYGARDPKGWGNYRGARRSDMVRWLEANGYARNSAEGQMREMVHQAMSGKYPRTKAILMGRGTGDIEHDTNSITKEFESPAVINRRSGAVRNAMRVGPGREVGDAGNTLPNGFPRILKPGHIDADGAGFAGAYRARQAEQDAIRSDMAPKVGERSLLQRSLRANGVGVTPNVEGAVNIRIDKPGPDTRVKADASGALFRTIKQTRGRQMQPAGDDV
ncbi:phage tail tip lysozyme [Methylobacterium sp. SI9]|uniref:phage tail tip lysozyme n=1 Tax=Methylobacterium guangdongense TaxID=3138811 RepID=UPI00313C72F6